MKLGVRFSYVDPTDPLWKQAVIRAIELVSGQPTLKRLYEQYDRNKDFFDEAVRLLRLKIAYAQHRHQSIPETGPLLVVANHPFGVVDGLAISHVIAKKRKDYLVVAHGLLTRAPEAAERILPIDFTASDTAVKTNLETRKKCVDWLNNGGCLIIFPAGGVSTSTTLFGRAFDERWKPFTARMIHASKAPVLPMFTAGQNSRAFQIASQYSEMLRTSLLFFEVYNKMGRRIDVEIGRPIAYHEIEHLKDRQELVDRLYRHVYALGNRESDFDMFDGEFETKPA